MSGKQLVRLTIEILQSTTVQRAIRHQKPRRFYDSSYLMMDLCWEVQSGLSWQKRATNGLVSQVSPLEFDARIALL